MKVISDIHSFEVDNGSRHELYVEGNEKSDKSIDSSILKTLFEHGGNNKITIKSLGSAAPIKAAAKSLSTHYPTNYFLIDRDHRSDKEVEKTWTKFPDKNNYNLLIWRRREIENYFIDPAYLMHSKYFTGSINDLKTKILNLVNKRLFLDIANLTLMSINEKLKLPGISLFDNIQDFKNSSSSFKKLNGIKEFKTLQKDVGIIIDPAEIKKEFDEFHKKMTNKKKKAKLDEGEWINLIKGKDVFHGVINSKNFQVKDQNGKLLKGYKKIHYIVEDLLGKEEEYLPKDFVELRKLINNITK